MTIVTSPGIKNIIEYKVKCLMYGSKKNKVVYSSPEFVRKL